MLATDAALGGDPRFASGGRGYSARAIGGEG